MSFDSFILRPTIGLCIIFKLRQYSAKKLNTCGNRTRDQSVFSHMRNHLSRANILIIIIIFASSVQIIMYVYKLTVSNNCKNITIFDAFVCSQNSANTADCDK